MRLILCLLALSSSALSSSALADVSVSVGAGKAITEQHMPFERSVALGYQYDLAPDFYIRPEGGYFLDISGNGKSSLWAAPLFGVRALSQTGPELHLAVGPGWLENPDQVLGGHFQFSLEGGIGISDKYTYIGMAWKHLSSAGFEMPNNGRDFITVQLRLLNL